MSKLRNAQYQVKQSFLFLLTLFAMAFIGIQNRLWKFK